LLTAVQGTESGKPAPSAACLAGAWPRLAVSTFPMNTSCTSAGSTLALLRAPGTSDLEFRRNQQGLMQPLLVQNAGDRRARSSEGCGGGGPGTYSGWRRSRAWWRGATTATRAARRWACGRRRRRRHLAVSGPGRRAPGHPRWTTP
jgi:hypothetical protein